jgi:hypothetical protein
MQLPAFYEGRSCKQEERNSKGRCKFQVREGIKPGVTKLFF